MAENGILSDRERNDSQPPKIYVGNLPPRCTERDLEDLCKQFGEVERADIVKNFGFVIYRNKNDALSAVTNLDGSPYQGVQLQAQMARSKLHVDGKDDNQCYECGLIGHWARECPKRIAQGGQRGTPGRGPVRNNEPHQEHRVRDPQAYRPPPRDEHFERPPARGRYDDYGRGYGHERPYERPPPPRVYDSYRGPVRRPPVEYAVQYRGRSRSPPPARHDYPPRSSDPYAREPYPRNPPPRDPYARDPYHSREGYTRRGGQEMYRRDPYPPRSSDPFSDYRQPQGSYASPYGTSQAKRFGDSSAPPSRAAPSGRY